MSTRFANPGDRVLDDNGNPLSSGKLYFYTPVSGSTTAKAIYSDSGFTTARANPVILPKSGLIPEIWLDGSYRLVITDKNGIQIDASDKINSASNASTISVDDTNNNGVSYPLTVQHETTDTPAAPIGVGIAFNVETSNNNTETGMTIEAVTTDVTSTSEDLTFRVKLMAAGAAAATVFDITSTGIINPYNDIQFTQANPEILGMDTDGVLITGPSTTNVLGAIIKQYGDTHATKAKDFEFLTDTTVQLHYDFSTTTFDFGANTITTTGAFNLSGVQTMTGASIIDANASIAAHATTMDPWSLGNYVTLTGGAVTFTAMANAPQAGAEVELYMNAAHTFTDGAVFIVDGDTNYTATAGDRVLLRAQSTTVFTVHPRKKDGTAVVAPSTVGDNIVTVHTGNGYGSTNTMIRRFTTTLVSTGSAITYADSAANGSSFTINEDGLYEIYYNDFANTGSPGGFSFGASLNSAELTTSIASITTASRLMYRLEEFTASNTVPVVCRTVMLSATDVVRPHTSGAATVNGATDKTYFSIRKVVAL